LESVIELFFNVVTVVVMLLCSFSLVLLLLLLLFVCLISKYAAMTSGVVAQMSDYGILRGVGLTKFELLRAFLEEALILVITAVLIGTVIGMMIFTKYSFFFFFFFLFII
jgi:ABC-type antimicrobial peptide transport system permease subunit